MKANRSRGSVVEALIMMAIICVLASVFLGASGGCTKSDGSRVGIITKFSHKGLICKSWEGELVMGGMRTMSGADGKTALAANVFEFSVLDEDLVKQIQALMESGHRARLTYSQTFFHNPVKRDTSYCIVEVKDLGN